MFTLDLSAVEYQGISLIRKDYIEIQKIVNRYYRNVKVKDNLHVCLKYFGMTKKIDDCISKETEILPFKSIGKQIILPVTGIGEYRKDGKIMNIALLVDDSSFMDIMVGNKTLFDYQENPCPNITVYVSPDTFTDEKGRKRPVTAVKKSDKCFMTEKLEEGEISHFIPFKEPVYVSGQLCFFRMQHPAFHVNMNAPRLITNAQLKADVTELMNAEFENEWKKERKEEAEKLEDRLFK